MAFNHSKVNHNQKTKKNSSGKPFYEDGMSRPSPKANPKSKERPEKMGKNKWRAHEFELGEDE
jgi:hypothetical protein